MMVLQSMPPFGPFGVAFALVVVVGLLPAVLGAKTRVSHFYPSGAFMWCMPASMDVSAHRSIEAGGIRVDQS